MNTTTKRIVIAASAALVLVAGSVFAFAQNRRGHFAGSGLPVFAQRFLDRASVFLDLTDQQEAQIKAILEAEKPKVQPLIVELAANRKALTEATDNGTFNEAQVKAIADKQGDTLAALIVEKERVKTQIYAVLTPEQRAKAEQFRARIEDRIKEHFNQ
ncbi:MAG TPA: Spy/CpxP family protein refolding chaperone [Blastocatellia bacterium]|nr:Spy/CpxP family protein refolding chaperone [Blastocatellia bacterium]HMV86239.1 Spy/CpxP family protein refolding chaperone [Blastocatellia bacterium]HMX28143.1 Spy/CpxP family protein refolding chaperone [Blastocatellia bacterium]HMY73400.1 Spy/CpxP family protein refolding chaperone [Blastocatellia bacterium]HMZ19060.1 Spy/CpxP family protein refolding chaperone [Blastocatellia bacterium]